MAHRHMLWPGGLVGVLVLEQKLPFDVTLVLFLLPVVIRKLVVSSRLHGGKTAVAGDGHKAHHDVAGKPDHAAVVAGAGGHGYYAAYAPDKAHDAPKLPAWHNKVVDDACYAYNTARLRHQAAPDHREHAHAAMDYHHYPSTTTTLVS
uniref:Uncharacterized protein n=1 Tax=Aegilops tauschii TaxID=37682 RepID=N1QQL9_AEGTA